jgi:hypothetical protein
MQDCQDLIELTFVVFVVQLDEQISSCNLLLMCLDYLTQHTLDIMFYLKSFIYRIFNLRF